MNERLRSLSLFCLAAFLGALVFITAFGSYRFHIEALEFDLSVGFLEPGVTAVQIPPIGAVSARTHLPPIKINLMLRNIDMDLLRRLLEASDAQRILSERTSQEAIRIIRVFVLRLLFLSAVGGAVGMLTLHRRKAADFARGALLGMMLTTGIFISIYLTFDLQGFRNPQYEGILKAAPQVVGMVSESLTKLDKLGEEMKVIAGNLYKLYGSIDRLQPESNKQQLLKVLHVSDIHNNPAAYDFTAQIVQSFGVDMVIDTGDLSDYGTPLEARLTGRLAQLEIPYVFVAGNHDSPAILEALQKIKNVIVLNGETSEIKGIRLAGIGDPSSLSNAISPPGEEAVKEYVYRLDQVLLRAKKVPDILLVHNPRIASAFAGRVPLILHGHQHRYSLSEKNGSVVIDAGTTGAAGIRWLQAREEIPYSLVLLEMITGPEGGWRLLAANIIRVYNLKSNYIIERHTFRAPRVTQGVGT